MQKGLETWVYRQEGGLLLEHWFCFEARRVVTRRWAKCFSSLGRWARGNDYLMRSREVANVGCVKDAEFGYGESQWIVSCPGR